MIDFFIGVVVGFAAFMLLSYYHSVITNDMNRIKDSDAFFWRDMTPEEIEFYKQYHPEGK